MAVKYCATSAGAVATSERDRVRVAEVGQQCRHRPGALVLLLDTQRGLDPAHRVNRAVPQQYCEWLAQAERGREDLRERVGEHEPVGAVRADHRVLDQLIDDVIHRGSMLGAVAVEELGQRCPGTSATEHLRRLGQLQAGQCRITQRGHERVRVQQPACQFAQAPWRDASADVGAAIKQRSEPGLVQRAQPPLQLSTPSTAPDSSTRKTSGASRRRRAVRSGVGEHVEGRAAVRRSR
jgi:hypothetical protein